MAKILIKIDLFILLGYFFISKAMIWFHLKRFYGAKWYNRWVYYNSSWCRLRSSGCGCLHGCCLRSSPARSSDWQFAQIEAQCSVIILE